MDMRKETKKILLFEKECRQSLKTKNEQISVAQSSGGAR